MKYLVVTRCNVVVVLISVMLTVSERPKYRDDYRYEKAFNAFYKIHQSAASWTEARIRCEAEGSMLLVPESLDEADAMPLLMTTIINRFKGVFIGIHDFYSERNFVTVTGKAMQDSILNLLWEKQEPKYRGGHCVAMRRSGRLFVHPCIQALPFICKIKAEGIVFKQECNTFDPRWEAGHNGSCYIIHKDPQTWYQAYATCLGAGGHLLVIRDRAEAKYVRDLFKQVAERRVPDNNFAFLGYSDLFQRHHFRTIHGERVNEAGYSDWDFQCPQDDNNVTKPLRCGGIRRSGLLLAGDCDIPSTFFCKKSPTKNRNTLRQHYIMKSHHHSHEKKETTVTDGLYETF
ncbi:hypothetical protein O3G_MSEX009292 [Manduca sexta]|uniref:C-type lectin domain-containing protein n=1 Tax=Manduca sexta TaxID=7130 RepID=A0A921ZCV5_MANSE|nr:hypothetical protein O3G_MSEX009292 [Manduca sexta]